MLAAEEMDRSYLVLVIGISGPHHVERVYHLGSSETPWRLEMVSRCVEVHCQVTEGWRNVVFGSSTVDSLRFAVGRSVPFLGRSFA